MVHIKLEVIGVKHINYEDKKKIWWEWHLKNPHVWKLFEKFSLQALDKGHKKLSHWLIINRIRWECAIETTGNDFKISNDFIAFYARYFNYKYPEHKGFFTIKKMKGQNNETH